MNVLYALWSIVAWLIALVLMSAVVLISLPLALFIPFERFQGGWPARIVGFVPRLTLSRLTCRRDSRFDPSRTCVYVMNHTSMLDGNVAIATLPHPFCGVENAGHLAVPGYGWLMRMANAIPVPRRAEGRTRLLIEAARDRAARGISILAFPEAHRTVDGSVREFRTGVFRMAREAGLPIVPVAARGIFHIFPKGRWWVRPGHIDVYIGPSLETAGLSDEELQQLARRTREIIVDWVERGETPADARASRRTAPLSATAP